MLSKIEKLKSKTKTILQETVFRIVRASGQKIKTTLPKSLSGYVKYFKEEVLIKRLQQKSIPALEVHLIAGLLDHMGVIQEGSNSHTFAEIFKERVFSQKTKDRELEWCEVFEKAVTEETYQ